MKKTLKFLVVLCFILSCIVLPMKSYGAEGDVIPWINGIGGAPVSETAGKLQYGFVGSRGRFEGVPEVAYMASLTNPIRHTNASSDGSIIGTPSFNVVMTEDEYQNQGPFLGHTNPFVLGSSVVLVKDPVSEAIDGLSEKKSVRATGYVQGHPEIKVEFKLFPNDTNSAIIHQVTLMNTTTESKTVYPMKTVDTDLNKDDQVPVYSRGKGKGIFIRTDKIKDDKTSGYYQLDYYTSGNGTEKGVFPSLYAGAKPGLWISEVFGPDKDNQGTVEYTERSMNTDYDESNPDEGIIEMRPLYGTSNDVYTDSAIYMSWGKVTIPPATISGGVTTPGTYTMRYDVGITVNSNTKKNKTVRNLTAESKGRTENYIGDELEYTISYESKEVLNDIEVKDVLDKGLDEPYDIKLKDTPSTNGNESGFSPTVKFDSDEKQYTITTNKLNLSENGKFDISFKTKLNSEAKDRSINNIATFSGETSEKTVVKEDVEVDKKLPVKLGTSKVIVKYMSEPTTLGGSVELQKAYEVEGEIDTNYNITGQKDKINGYKFSRVDGEETGKYGEKDTTITYYYTPDTYSISQSALDQSKNDIDGKSVEMGQKITFKTDITSKLADNGTKTYYDNFAISTTVSPNVENIENIYVKTSTGKTIKKGQYDASTNTVSVIINASDGIESHENIEFYYDATVKNVFDTTVEAQATASGGTTGGYTTSNPKLIAETQKSNVVNMTRGAGNLEFSASDTWNFGENDLSDKTERYQVKDITTKQLTVTDNSAIGNKWKVSVKLGQEFTNTANSNVLKNVLYYNAGGSDDKDILIPLDSAAGTGSGVQIGNGETTATTRGQAINIASDWNNKKGLFLNVPGYSARKGNYEAVIVWTAESTP